MKYDCCPGYRRTELVNNQCAERTPTYLPIYSTLMDMKKIDTADVFHKVIPELESATGNKDFTVFVPEMDKDTQSM